ncbi:hypothetical protein ANN_05949 [Periplaneta americana]|uniref:GIY-YIG domain-containing protein n=1 Tax=Periplaneta americana TaxID=6978 RepID=A0ABQ8TCA6_PERAM|nr:hypothetical protein ANN_05949 [Periplaneta americana]
MRKGTEIGRGVRQVCPLSPTLFNNYLEDLVKNCFINMGGVIVGGRRIKCIRFADDMALLAEEEMILKDMLMELNDSFGEEVSIVTKKKRSEETTPVAEGNRRKDLQRSDRCDNALMSDTLNCTAVRRPSVSACGSTPCDSLARGSTLVSIRWTTAYGPMYQLVPSATGWMDGIAPLPQRHNNTDEQVQGTILALGGERSGGREGKGALHMHLRTWNNNTTNKGTHICAKKEAKAKQRKTRSVHALRAFKRPALAFQTGPRTNNTLQKHNTQTTQTNKYNHTGVYNLKCNTCNNFYIGQTGRSFQTRYKEHITAIIKLQNISTYAEHITNANHTHRDINTDMEILHIQPKSQKKLNTLEQYEIYRHTKTHPNEILNTQLNFKTHSLTLHYTTGTHPHRIQNKWRQDQQRPVLKMTHK